MPRSRVFAIAATIALAACAGQEDYPGFSTTGLETVDDAAAIAAGRPTGSQYAATTIGAIDTIGSLINGISDFNADGAASHSCLDGSEVFAPSRSGNPDSTEARRYFDSGCRHLASDAVRIFNPLGGGRETESIATSLYSMHRTAPIATRVENAQIAGAQFDRWGFPTARGGFARASSVQLFVANQRRSIASSETTIVPSASDGATVCQDSAGYDAAGIPSLDATFGWQSTTMDTPAAIRITHSDGNTTISATQIGSTFAGPVGSLSLLAGLAQAGCPPGKSTFALIGGTAASAFTIPIRATFRNGRLVDLSVYGAAFAGGYRADLAGRRNARGLLAISGALVNGRTAIASIASDAFGNGELNITSTGMQYRLVDWTVVL